MFSYGCSSPLEVARQCQLSKNFDDLLYDLELDAGEAIHSGSYLDVPFCSRGTVNLYSEQEQKVSTGKAHSRFNINASSLKNSFADDKLSYNIADEDNDIWKDGNFLDEDCDITWNGSPLEINGSSDFWNLGSHEMVSENSRGNISDSPRPHYRQRRSRNNHDFLFPDRTWIPKVRRDCDLRDITNQPAWSSHLTEDAGESLSLLSEESCSSRAVRNNANKRSPSNSEARLNIRWHGNNISSPANKCNSEEYAKVRLKSNSDDLFEGKKINGPQKFAKICNSSNPNQSHFSTALFHEKLGPEDSFSCEEGYISAKMDSGFSSFRQTSGSEKCASTHPKIWTKDPFGAYPLPGADANVKSSFDRSKYDVIHELSPSGSFPQRNFHSANHMVMITLMRLLFSQSLGLGDANEVYLRTLMLKVDLRVYSLLKVLSEMQSFSMCLWK